MVNTKTNLSCITLTQKKESQELLQDLLLDGALKGESVRITKGEETLKVIVNQEILSSLKKKYDGAILATQTDLAELQIVLNEKACATKGVFARITNEIANQDINITEVITASPELLIFVKRDDLIKAHDAVFSIVHTKGQDLPKNGR
jgi:aspartokinase